MYDHGVSQPKIEHILSAADEVEGITQGQISNLVNAESFEEVYSS